MTRPKGQDREEENSHHEKEPFTKEVHIILKSFDPSPLCHTHYQ